MKLRIPLFPQINRWLSGAAVLLVCGAATASADSYAETVLADNPVAYYRFEDAADSMAITNAANPEWHLGYLLFDEAGNYPKLQQPGIENNSVAFHLYTPEGGVEQRSFIEVTYAEELNPSGPFTIEFWARVTSWGAGNRCIVGNVSDFNNGWWFRQEPGATPRWLYVQNGGGIYMAGGSITSKEWAHLVVTYDGSTIRFYGNGQQQWSVANPPTPAINLGGPLRIGGNSATGDGFFDGNVDELAIYASALTEDQVKLHYAVGLTNITLPPAPAVITADPEATEAYSGRAATFSVTADGALPLSYQWYKNAEPIPGANEDVLNYVCNYETDNNAVFTVVVTNAYGSDTSEPATLTVLTNLILEASPDSVTRTVGGKAAFIAVAGGALPVTYQWYKGTTPLPGATNQMLWVSNLTPADDQTTYYAKISNPWDTLDTGPATLTVVERTTPVPDSGYAKVVMLDDPVGYWRLNEPDWSFYAVDSAGNFDGEYTPGEGTITYGVMPGIPRETDPAIAVSGKAEVRVPWALELNPHGPFSVEVWLKPASFSAEYRNVFTSMGLGQGGGSGPNGWLLYQQPNNTLIWVLFSRGWNAAWLGGSWDLELGAWHHAVMTYDGSVFRSYINGQFGAELIYAAFVPNGDGYASFGHRFSDGGAPFDGALDDIAFYNKALTADQIQAHYYATVKLGLQQTDNNLILSWPFGTLQQSDQVDGPYADLSAATSPHTVPIGNAAKYYRVKVQ
ncbi:MAG TPA: hypothetical protein PLT00_08595 [Verrucomicrobiota bacterium]|nr:hypothetical protein [Verrucomicrobiota bacterium]HQB16753.1 hypothetical protein [Verrucomicrobiota bacterium]